MPRERGATRDENGWMARLGIGHRRGHADGKGERGRLARSGRHLAGRPESRDEDSSPRHPPGRRMLAGKMPARTGRRPALPRNATLQSLPQFSRQIPYFVSVLDPEIRGAVEPEVAGSGLISVLEPERTGGCIGWAIEPDREGEGDIAAPPAWVSTAAFS
jgi:hypothetical protein